MRLRWATGTISNLPKGQQKVSQQNLGGPFLSAFIRGIPLPREDPRGPGYFLQPCDKYQTLSTQAQADGPSGAQGNSAPSLQAELICSSPAQIRPLLSRLPSLVSTSLLLRARLSSSSPLALAFIFRTRRLHPAPRVSVRLLGYVSPLKFAFHFL